MRDAHLSSALAPSPHARPAPGPGPAAALHRPVFRQVPAARHPLHTPREVVLLSGSVWRSGLRGAIGRPVLELPVAADRTLLDIWRERIAELGQAIGQPDLPVRILVAHGEPMPADAEGTLPGRHLMVQRDEAAFRGTGGVLRDLTANDDADTLRFIANAGQLPLEPLAPLLYQLAACDADLSFIAHYDGTPSRLMLVRSSCLRVLPRIGFVDLMEQGLPVIASDHRVAVLHRAHAASLPVRTRAGYIQALQRYHRRLNSAGSGGSADGAGGASSGGEEWRSSFALVEAGAEVHRSACLHDSVVLRGGRVERGATIARSVVCPGGVVPAGAVVVNALVASTAVEHG